MNILITKFFDALLHQFEELMRRIVREELDSTSIEPNPSQLATEGEDLLTLQEACSLFKRSAQTIHNWKRQGLLPFHRMGGRIYFKKSECLEALKRIDLSNPKNRRA